MSATMQVLLENKKAAIAVPFRYFKSRNRHELREKAFQDKLFTGRDCHSGL